MEFKDWACSILTIIFVVSTLLIFVINWWLVVIINVVELVILLWIFKAIEMEASIWVYIIECILCIGIMVAVIIFPEKVCGGIMSDLKDPKRLKYIAEMLNISSNNVTPAEISKRFHIFAGIVSSAIIACLILVGVTFICKILKVEVEFFSCYLAVPLFCMVGLLLLNLPIPIGASMSMAIGIVVSPSLMGIGFAWARADGGGSGGYGGGDTYHVFIFKD